MYKKNAMQTIAKKRYSFKKGYMQVQLADRNAVRKELMNILGISYSNYLSRMLSEGIANISVDRYDAITRAFARRGIFDVWTIEEK